MKLISRHPLFCLTLRKTVPDIRIFFLKMSGKKLQKMRSMSFETSFVFEERVEGGLRFDRNLAESKAHLPSPVLSNVWWVKIMAESTWMFQSSSFEGDGVHSIVSRALLYFGFLMLSVLLFEEMILLGLCPFRTRRCAAPREHREKQRGWQLTLESHHCGRHSREETWRLKLLLFINTSGPVGSFARLP